ncbi:hypothetical protein AVEN_15376-1 [Araneus ventricosus]|uniref:Uncharacterized protein n=1 Tax=Araneus ventricosus TaxID=182803 RepID=A0A4Y2HIX5_ARAVE|nr:hypothetical protein AVEN_15376-1 [Araneus ventricosus]
MHSMNVPLNKLWQLEVLGISSPTETEKEKGDLDLNDFNDKMKILPDGRYEVELPWKYDSKNLPSNKELVWKRHDRMINRFGKGDFFPDYPKVFQNWGKLNNIERMPDFELNRECHYSSHRPVIKLDSQTTKIHPVSDASASQRGDPSLNKCLFKGINLIELIPDILDRFRMYPIDACKGAYVACVFVRSEVEGESKVRLIRAKNRVAPLKSLTIPRLELMACCIGARLVNSVIKAIDASSKSHSGQIPLLLCGGLKDMEIGLFLLPIALKRSES